MKQNSLKIARAAMILASALILGLVENLLPPVVPAVPFIKGVCGDRRRRALCAFDRDT